MTTKHRGASTSSLANMFGDKQPDPFVWSGISNQNPGGLSFFELLKEDFEAHDRRWSPGFRALAVHRFGNWRMDVSTRALRVPLSVIYRWLHRRMIRQYGIELEYAAEIGRRVVIDHQSGIIISGFCRIGDGCRLRQGVTMGVRRIGEFGCPTVGRNVDVGVGAVILGDIHIGDGAAIGANAVVIRDVPAGALAVGVPARIIDRATPAAPGATTSAVATGSTISPGSRTSTRSNPSTGPGADDDLEGSHAGDLTAELVIVDVR